MKNIINKIIELGIDAEKVETIKIFLKEEEIKSARTIPTFFESFTDHHLKEVGVRLYAKSISARDVLTEWKSIFSFNEFDWILQKLEEKEIGEHRHVLKSDYAKDAYYVVRIPYANQAEVFWITSSRHLVKMRIDLEKDMKIFEVKIGIEESHEFYDSALYFLN